MILIIFVSLLLVILYFIYKQIVNLINLVDSLFAVVSKNIDGVKQNSDTIINEVIEKYDETQAGGSFDPINIMIIAPSTQIDADAVNNSEQKQNENIQVLDED